jgi:hypothetical protein
MQFGGIVRPQCCGDAALGIPRVAFGGTSFREEQDFAGTDQVSERSQSSDAAPDHDVIGP